MYHAVSQDEFVELFLKLCRVILFIEIKIFDFGAIYNFFHSIILIREQLSKLSVIEKKIYIEIK